MLICVLLHVDGVFHVNNFYFAFKAMLCYICCVDGSLDSGFTNLSWQFAYGYTIWYLKIMLSVLLHATIIKEVGQYSCKTNRICSNETFSNRRFLNKHKIVNNMTSKSSLRQTQLKMSSTIINVLLHFGNVTFITSRYKLGQGCLFF